jgi:acetyltransferase
MQYSSAKFDPSQNYLERPLIALDKLFNPQSIAVVGASEREGSVGRTLIQNVCNKNYKGRVYPVNPKRTTLFDQKCYPTIASLPETVDLAVIAVPAASVPQAISDCADRGVKGAIIISAGFREIGPAGIALEKQVLEHAWRGKIRLIGPNCLGIMVPSCGLNATFAASMALKGQIAFLSQSGAMCTAVLDKSLQEKIGFSSFVSVGAMIDVDWGDMIAYLGNDPHTQSILIYMESIGNARSFLSAAREVALTKPIILIKPGRTSQAAAAATSHTGALAGSDEVFDAALERVGVLRVETISELFDMAQVLGKQPRPQGANLAILTNAGGPAVLATDAALMNGSKLAPLLPTTLSALDKILPAAWSHHNPIDLLGDAPPDLFGKALAITAKDSTVDGLLVILTPQAMTDATATASEIARQSQSLEKPLLCSWMGGEAVAKGCALLNDSGIPTFPYSDSAARAFALMWRYSENLRALYETPLLRNDLKHEKEAIGKTQQLIQETLQQGRTLLTEEESKRLLAYYDIPVCATYIAQSSQEAVRLAEKIGYPVVMKMLSHTITHKSDLGGVLLNLTSKEQVIEAFASIRKAVEKVTLFEGVTLQKMVMGGLELIVGSSIDPQFGPVVLFGTGGKWVEIYRDRALSLPPLNSTLARRLIESTKISAALHGARGQPKVDIIAIERVLVRFSQMIVENPQIQECDINPLVAASNGCIALDARVVLCPPSTPKEALPKPAIRPYPIQYLTQLQLNEGLQITLRPIRSEDEPLMEKFHKTLSEWSVRQRYLEPFSLDQRIQHQRLLRVCTSDFDRDLTLIAVRNQPEEIIGLGRLRRLGPSEEAHLIVVVADNYQKKGLGRQLLTRLIQVAKEEKIRVIHANVLSENKQMLRLLGELDFRFEPLQENPHIIQAQLDC